jgi:hypothetical protein
MAKRKSVVNESVVEVPVEVDASKDVDVVEDGFVVGEDVEVVFENVDVKVVFAPVPVSVEKELFLFPGDLRIGNGGVGVADLQKLLNKALGGTLNVDGQFGPWTKAALVKFADVYGYGRAGILTKPIWDELIRISNS